MVIHLEVSKDGTLDIVREVALEKKYNLADLVVPSVNKEIINAGLFQIDASEHLNMAKYGGKCDCGTNLIEAISCFFF